MTTVQIQIWPLCSKGCIELSAAIYYLYIYIICPLHIQKKILLDLETAEFTESTGYDMRV